MRCHPLKQLKKFHVTTMAKSYGNPYNPTKSSDNKGVIHGSGITGQYGTKKGSYTDGNSAGNVKYNKPPRKLA